MTSDPLKDLRSLGNENRGFDQRVRPWTSGTAANRPAANLMRPNTFYYETDTGNEWFSDGSTWTLVGGIGRRLAYQDFQSSVNLTVTTEATANTVVTAQPVTGDGASLVLIHFFSPRVDTPGAAIDTIFWLYEQIGAGTAASVGRLGDIRNEGALHRQAMKLERHLAPPTGTITYSVRGSVSSGTATVWAGNGTAGNFMPGFIRIERDV